MKKFFISAMILSLAIVSQSCRNDDPETRATGVSLTPGSATLAFGETLQLAATVFPTDAIDVTVTWESSADTVATVDADGLVTAVTDDGEATITVKTVDGGFTAQSIITITSSILANRCNTNMPNWGPSLGETGFASSSVWEIRDENNVLIQTWSDAVTASNCGNRVDFNGGADDERGFNADCRSNPNFDGDVFSWCAVVRFAHLLCPYPWRVPTPDDFAALHVAIGGTGEAASFSAEIFGALREQWGGQLAGTFTWFEQLNTNVHQNANVMGIYWASASFPSTANPDVLVGGAFYTDSWNTVSPRSSNMKNVGLPLRCVK